MNKRDDVLDTIEAFIAGEVGEHLPGMRRQAEDLLDALSGSGIVCVYANSLSHGDTLDQQGWAYRLLHRPLRHHLCADEPTKHPIRWPVYGAAR